MRLSLDSTLVPLEALGSAVADSGTVAPWASKVATVDMAAWAAATTASSTYPMFVVFRDGRAPQRVTTTNRVPASLHCRLAGPEGSVQASRYDWDTLNAVPCPPNCSLTKH